MTAVIVEASVYHHMLARLLVPNRHSYFAICALLVVRKLGLTPGVAIHGNASKIVPGCLCARAVDARCICRRPSWKSKTQAVLCPIPLHLAHHESCCQLGAGPRELSRYRILCKRGAVPARGRPHSVSRGRQTPPQVVEDVPDGIPPTASTSTHLLF